MGAAWWCSDMAYSCLLGVQTLGFSRRCQPRSVPTDVFFPRPPCLSYKAICRWLLLVLGLEIPRRSQAMNVGWLLLVPGPWLLSKTYRGWGLTETGCCLFERIWEVVKHEPRPAIHMEKSWLTIWVVL